MKRASLEGEGKIEASHTVRGFSYAALAADCVDVTQQDADWVNGRFREITAHAFRGAVEIGERLLLVKERIGHGMFGQWVAVECRFTRQTAHNMMNVALAFGEQMSNAFDIWPMRVIYELAKPSTPTAVRQEIVACVEGGEAIDGRDVLTRIADAKQADERKRVEEKRTPAQRRRIRHSEEKHRQEIEEYRRRDREKKDAADKAVSFILEKLGEAQFSEFCSLAKPAGFSLLEAIERRRASVEAQITE